MLASTRCLFSINLHKFGSKLIQVKQQCLTRQKYSYNYRFVQMKMYTYITGSRISVASEFLWCIPTLTSENPFHDRVLINDLLW